MCLCMHSNGQETTLLEDEPICLDVDFQLSYSIDQDELWNLEIPSQLLAKCKQFY